MITEVDVQKIRDRDPKTELMALGADERQDTGKPLPDRTWEEKFALKFSVPICQDDLKRAYELGVIKKEQLVDGKYYWGICRNARVARWSSKDGLFYHQRWKGSWYVESIPHPENEQIQENFFGRTVGFDIFIPWLEVEPLPYEKVEVISGNVARNAYQEIKKDSKTKVIESPYPNADLVQSGDRFAVLDHGRQEITYYMEYKELDLESHKALYQDTVWKSWCLMDDKEIPQRVFWKHLFPVHGVVTTNNIETDLGTGFWNNVVVDALRAGKHVYFLDLNSKEGPRPIRSHDDLHVVHKSIWGKGDLNRLRFVLISEWPFCSNGRIQSSP